jgi:hypothetical protein
MYTISDIAPNNVHTIRSALNGAITTSYSKPLARHPIAKPVGSAMQPVKPPCNEARLVSDTCGVRLFRQAEELYFPHHALQNQRALVARPGTPWHQWPASAPKLPAGPRLRPIVWKPLAGIEGAIRAVHPSPPRRQRHPGQFGALWRLATEMVLTPAAASPAGHDADDV